MHMRKQLNEETTPTAGATVGLRGAPRSPSGAACVRFRCAGL